MIDNDVCEEKLSEDSSKSPSSAERTNGHTGKDTPPTIPDAKSEREKEAHDKMKFAEQPPSLVAEKVSVPKVKYFFESAQFKDKDVKKETEVSAQRTSACLLVCRLTAVVEEE